MALGVIIGAFGAHALGTSLSPDLRAVYQTGVLYHLLHGFGVILVGWLSLARPHDPAIRAAGWAFILGILVFSGSLYLVSAGGLRKLGAITPIGGLCFILGWGLLAWASR